MSNEPNILTVSVQDPRDIETIMSEARTGSRGSEPRLAAHNIENRQKERTVDVVTSETREKTFEDLLLSAPVLQGLNNSGYVRPSPVQLQAIPEAKVGFDCIVQSKSGTGKTCVYVVTALEMVKPDLSALQVVFVHS